MSYGGYKKFEYGERELGASDIDKVSRTYGVSKEEALEQPKTSPIVGYVGAGSVAHYYELAQGPFDEAPMPPNGTAETVAVEIRGESLGSLFDRWLVYYNDVRRPPTLDMLRKLCVVGLHDDRVLVKQLLRGSEPGHFHLFSQIEGLIENVRVDWAATVLAMTPR